MAFYFNGTQIETVYFNGTVMDTVVFNGTTVYESSTDYVLYDSGTEYVSFSQGLNSGGGQYTNVLTEGASDVRVYSSAAAGGGEVSWVSDSTIDLTDYSTLEYTTDSTVTSPAEFVVAVGTSRTAGRGTYDARNLYTSNTSGTFTLDVSGLSGSYYIRFHAYCAPYSGSDNYISYVALKE